MASNGICNIINQLDFQNENDIRLILKQDKHTRIEGLCSEAAFMEDVVQGNLSPVTGDFWFTKTHNSYEVTRVVTDPTINLTELDYRILDGFVSKVNVSIVWFNEQSREFIRVPHVKLMRYNDIKKVGTVMPPKEQTEMPNASERDERRLNQACDYLTTKGLLKQSAIKRLFANCWLSGPVWDIDAFTTMPTGQIIALEVKQKYPTAKGTFGINDGQKMLFQFLLSLGMPVFHIVLQKPVNDINISAVDFLTKPEYTNQTVWLFTRFLTEKLKQAIQKAPSKTSIYGNSELSYSHIPVDRFTVLKQFGQSSQDIAAKMFNV